MPPVPTYDEAYGGLAGVYDPQTSLVNQQLSTLPDQENAVQASLDQAKVNAFRDITQGANARGVMFSGVPIDQQGQYVGTKYLPAVAANKTNFQNQKFTLQDKINQINAQRSGQAQGIVSDAQKAANDYAYQQSKLAIAASKASSSGGLSASQLKALQQQQDQQGAYGDLRAKIGGDGYVSPNVWKAVLNNWVAAGYSASSFGSAFANFKNPKNSAYVKT